MSNDLVGRYFGDSPEPLSLPDKRNHASLLDYRQLLLIANIPRQIVEPIATLLSEAFEFRDQELAHWLFTQIQINTSGDGYRSGQIVEVLKAELDRQTRIESAIGFQNDRHGGPRRESGENRGELN